MNALLLDIIALAKQAGKEILSHYHDNLTCTYKADGSPVTVSDIAAQQLICDGLKLLTPGIPVIAEEWNTVDFKERQHCSRYWLVDPLDGTKEFLEKNGEFTVNIALIEQGAPVLGVIYAPVFDFCYFAENNGGAFKQIMQQSPQRLQTRLWQKDAPITMAISRRHGTACLQDFFSKFASLSLVRCGSALKFCYLAEGFVDLYPRFSPTHEWDTAAGQCILQEAGGAVLDHQGFVLRYNTRSAFLNAAFLAVGDTTHDWPLFFI